MELILIIVVLVLIFGGWWRILGSPSRYLVIEGVLEHLVAAH